MIVDIDRLPRQGLRVSRDFEFQAEETLEEDALFLQPVHADLIVRKEGEEVYVKGRITGLLRFVCSRCLSLYDFPVDAQCDLLYLPGEFEEAKDELESEDLETSFYYDRKINLREVVLEQLNLTFPVKPLCSPDCQGLCPVCGGDINCGECSCEPETVDPRLEKLTLFWKDKR